MPSFIGFNGIVDTKLQFFHYLCNSKLKATIMNRWIITLLVSVCTLAIQAQDIEYTQSDSALVVKLLDVAKHQRGTENPIFYFGKKFLGLPYVAHTLELGDKEHLIVNLHGLDCTTFVETVVALSMCDQQDRRTFDAFCQNLSKIRFREGKMTDYTSRLPYFTWWQKIMSAWASWRTSRQRLLLGEPSPPYRPSTSIICQPTLPSTNN